MSDRRIHEMEQRRLQEITRRHFFQRCQVGLGAIGLSSLLAKEGYARASERPLAPSPPHYPPKAKNVIFLHQAGGPSQFELFDDKPKLREYDGEPAPDSYINDKRFAFIGKDAKLLGSRRSFGRYGDAGIELSELLPYHRRIADEICVVKSMRTDVFNHGPAKLFTHTGFAGPGRPSDGSWVTYGIGSESENLPGFVVLQSGPRGPRAGSALWSSGFLPTTHQGTAFRSGGEPILNLSNPAGFNRRRQRDFVSAVGDLNQQHLDVVGDPEISTRIAQYEMAYRMQASAPDLVDLSDESQSTLDLYGIDNPNKPSFAKNCLLARRMVERGVRFVQLYHTDWDHHGSGNNTLGKGLDIRCRQTDQPSAALILDLKQRGLLDDTLVIWGGEFGRTPMGEQRQKTGRDHHIDAYSLWLAGAGIKRGATVGKTDPFGLTVVEDPYHVHDLQATMLHLLGLDHKRLTFRFQGRDFRLTDVHGHLMDKVLV